MNSILKILDKRYLEKYLGKRLVFGNVQYQDSRE